MKTFFPIQVRERVAAERVRERVAGQREGVVAGQREGYLVVYIVAFFLLSMGMVLVFFFSSAKVFTV